MIVIKKGSELVMMLQIITLILVTIVLAILLFLIFGRRWIFKAIVKKIGNIIFTDSYQENLIELIPGLAHVGLQNMLENNLRADSGEVLHRPIGGSRSWPHLSSLTFIPAQITTFPTDSDDEVDVKITIGPKAKKPLNTEIPLLISGMAYGLALSEHVRMALAKAAKEVNTAINTGEGVVLPEELKLGGKLILQFSKTAWAKEQKLYKQVDMIEIKLGQGAKMGMGAKIQPENLTGRARKLMGLKKGEVAQIYEHFFDDQTIDDLKDLVKELRKVSGGVPIGVKIAAGGRLEEDIEASLHLGIDFISIDGGQGSTHGGAPILSDSFGIPTLHAVVRAVNHLERLGKKDSVSLIVSGGLFTPSEFLKVLALGADAVYIGSALLFAVTHNQSLKAVPFEPPTEVAFHEGKFANQFNIDDGAQAAANYLTSSVEEIKEGIRAMGKHSLKEISRQDLVSFDETTAKFVGVPFSFVPWSDMKNEEG